MWAWGHRAWVNRELAKRIEAPYCLVFLPHLQAACRQHTRQLWEQAGWSVDLIVWSLTWGVHIQAVGSGQSAIKYLGNYVARTALSDSRIQRVTGSAVILKWRDRADHNRLKSLQLSGIEFLERYFRHVLPTGLRSVRYCGFCVRRHKIPIHVGSQRDCCYSVHWACTAR